MNTIVRSISCCLHEKAPPVPEDGGDQCDQPSSAATVCHLGGRPIFEHMFDSTVEVRRFRVDLVRISWTCVATVDGGRSGARVQPRRPTGRTGWQVVLVLGVGLVLVAGCSTGEQPTAAPQLPPPARALVSWSDTVCANTKSVDRSADADRLGEQGCERSG